MWPSKTRLSHKMIPEGLSHHTGKATPLTCYPHKGHLLTLLQRASTFTCSAFFKSTLRLQPVNRSQEEGPASRLRPPCASKCRHARWAARASGVRTETPAQRYGRATERLVLPRSSSLARFLTLSLLFPFQFWLPSKTQVKKKVHSCRLFSQANAKPLGTTPREEVTSGLHAQEETPPSSLKPSGSSEQPPSGRATHSPQGTMSSGHRHTQHQEAAEARPWRNWACSGAVSQPCSANRHLDPHMNPDSPQHPHTLGPSHHSSRQS